MYDTEVVDMQPDSGFLPFALPDIGQEEIDKVVSVLKTGWITTGPVCREFEAKFASYVNAHHALAVSSATAGFDLAFAALGIGPGDEVITTPHTFSSPAMSVMHLGATPVFVDVDPHTLNLDAARIEERITPRTKAILVVHFSGLAADMVGIAKVARKHGLKIVEDAAHALPATYRGRMVGSLPFSDATVFSFYATKTITTAEGGMVTTFDVELAERMRRMRLHGISRDVFDRYTSNTASWFYEIVDEGWKANLPDLLAAVGLAQLERCTTMWARRAEIADAYMTAFKDLPLQLPATPLPGDQHAWHLFVVRLRDHARNDVIDKLRGLGIGTSVHFIPLPLHRFWQEHVPTEMSTVANSIFQYARSISLPIYPKMTDADVERVIAGVRTCLA